MKKQDTLGNQVNYAYLALGSNLGKKIKNLELAKYMLFKNDVKIIKTSSFYSSNSWPNKQIKLIEKILGRVNAPKNHPRICDIDIIDFNGKCLSTSFNFQKIKIPHLNMHKRNFVLIPLYEINQNWFHPKIKKNIVKLLCSLPDNELRGIKFS